MGIENVKGEQFELMLGNLASELAPLYEGNVVVQRKMLGAPVSLTGPCDIPYRVISEMKPKKKVLGIFPTTNTRPIAKVPEYGWRPDLTVYLEDGRAKEAIEKYLEKNAEEYGIRTISII